VTDPGDTAGRRETERAALLDSLWRKLLAIHQEEVARSVVRLKWASEETRAAAETLSIEILRTVFSGWSAAILGFDEESPTRARMVVELFDLPAGEGSEARLVRPDSPVTPAPCSLAREVSNIRLVSTLRRPPRVRNTT
jgi:hypothetical protein